MKQTATNTAPAAHIWANNLTPDEALQLAHQAANTALKARPRTAFIEQLLTYGRMERHHKPAQIAALLAEYEDEHEQAAEQAAEAWQAAEELAADDDTAAAWVDIANEQTNRRNAARANADDTRKALFDRVSTDFCDIRAAALVQYYNTVTDPATVPEHIRNSVGPATPTAALLAQYDAESMDDLTPEQAAEVQGRANYKSMIAAAGQALNACRQLDGMDGHHTDTRPADPATVAAWVKAYCGTGKEYRRELPRGQYQTCEYLEATKRRPAGWYIVTHRRTVKAAHSVDQLTAEGLQIVEDTDNRREVAAADAVDYLAAVVKAANLPPRAAAWVAAYTSDTAQAAAAEAMDAYAAKVRKWTAKHRKALRNAGHMAARAHADSVTGYTPNSNTANQAYKRIIDRMSKAAERVTLTNSGKAKHTDRQTAAYIRAAFANRQPFSFAPAGRADLLTWIAANPAPVDPGTHEAAAKAAEVARAYEAAADSATTPAQAAAKAAADERRRTWTAHTLDALQTHRTHAAFAALDAAQAAKVFLDSMTPDELQTAADQWSEDERRKAAEATEAQAAAAQAEAEARAAERRTHAEFMAKHTAAEARRAARNATRAQAAAEAAKARAATAPAERRKAAEAAARGAEAEARAAADLASTTAATAARWASMANA